MIKIALLVLIISTLVVLYKKMCGGCFSLRTRYTINRRPTYGSSFGGVLNTEPFVRCSEDKICKKCGRVIELRVWSEPVSKLPAKACGTLTF